MQIGQNNVTFGARIKLAKAKELVNDVAKKSAAGGIISGTSASTTGPALTVISTRATGSASIVTGTAFVSQSLGTNSSGIVPTVLGAMKSIFAPSVVESTAAHPSIAGSVFSTGGCGLIKSAKIEMRLKRPS